MILDKNILFIILFFTPTISIAAEFRVENYHIQNDNGYYKLEWDSSPGAEVELQRSSSSDFNEVMVIYNGVDRASYISGLENGTYYFRVRELGGKWSQTLVLEVQHQSLTLAFTLFGLGGFVFLLTVLVVVKGSKQMQRQ